MKNRKVAWLLTVLMMVAAVALGQFKAPVKQSDSFYLTDKAGLFSAAEESAILSDCQALLQQGGARMVVVTVRHTGLRSMGSYAETLWNQWKLSGIDLLLVMKADDYYFLYGSELSYAMDHNYRDLMDRYLEPAFAVKDYDTAVRSFISATGTVLRGGSIGGAPGAGMPISDGSGAIVVFLFFLLLIIVLAVLFSSKRPASKRTYYGGYATPGRPTGPIIINTRPAYRPSSRPASRPVSRPGSFGGGGRSSFGGSRGGFGGGGGRGGGSRGGGGRR